jgi:hypothetical protein
MGSMAEHKPNLSVGYAAFITDLKHDGPKGPGDCRFESRHRL